MRRIRIRYDRSNPDGVAARSLLPGELPDLGDLRQDWQRRAGFRRLAIGGCGG
jgi:hypothetical protein